MEKPRETGRRSTEGKRGRERESISAGAQLIHFLSALKAVSVKEMGGTTERGGDCLYFLNMINAEQK